MKKFIIPSFLIFSTSLTFAQELTLENCIQIALQNNKNIQISKESLKSSQADETIARAGFIPELNISATSSKTEYGKTITEREIDVTDSTGTASTVLVPIESDGFTTTNHSLSASLTKTWNYATLKSYQRSNLEVEQSETKLKDTKSQIVTNVTESYLNLLQAQELEKVYSENVKLSEEQLKRAESLYKVGTQTKASFLQSKVSLGTDKIRLLEQKENVKVSRANLNINLGKDPFEALEVSEDFPKVIPEINFEELIQSFKNNNFSLNSKELDIKKADKSREVAKSGYFPNLTGSLSYGRSNSDLGEVYGSFDRNWSFTGSATLSMNLFNGFQTSANLQKAEISKIIAKRDFERTLQNLSLDLLRNYEDLQTTIQVIQINRERIESAEEDLKLAKERYSVGSGTQLEYRDTQVALIRAKADLVISEFDAQKALAKLNELTGKNNY